MGGAHSDRPLGWTDVPLPNGIDLRIQCAASSEALQYQQVEMQHVLMTRNRALFLAKYLLDATEQSLLYDASLCCSAR
jgi:hypothetical protein